MSRAESPSTQPRRPRRPTAALIVASLALVVAAAPPAYAAIRANSVGSKQIKNRSIANVDLGVSVVGSGNVANGSLGLGDLADIARWRRTMTGSWDHLPGVVGFLSTYPATTTLGSLSSDGTGALRVSRPSRILVDGSVLAQNQSGAGRSIGCNVVVGTQTLSPTTTALLVSGSSVPMALSASTTVNPGTYDVSVTCYSGGSNGMTAGNVHVNVVAVPLN